MEKKVSNIPPMSIVDVRDVSVAHLVAATKPEAAN